MKSAVGRGMFAVAVLFLIAAAAVAQQQPTVSKTTSKGTPAATTYTLTGTVVEVQGNTLVVKMTAGDIRMFTPPAGRRFLIDGKELTLSELQPGTKLKATVTETTTPVTDRTVQSLAGTVWYASGPTVILTLPSGENRMYTVKADDPIQFRDGSGKDMSVFDLRKDMHVTAVKVTEAPRTEFANTGTVTGTAPGKATPGPAASGAKATAPASGAKATATGSEKKEPAASGEPAAAPRKLPKTAGPLPLGGLIGLGSLLTAVGLTVRRRRQ